MAKLVSKKKKKKKRMPSNRAVLDLFNRIIYEFPKHDFGELRSNYIYINVYVSLHIKREK